MSETFSQTERTIGKRSVLKKAIVTVDRVGNKLTLYVEMYKENSKRSYLETATLELFGEELKRFKKAVRGAK